MQSHLDAEGMAQAAKLAARLSPLAFHAAYSSDLLRTQATARTILDGRPPTLQLTEELRELAYGRWEGLTRKEIETAFASDYQQYMRGDIAFAPEGGESAAQLLARLTPLTERLLEEHPDEDILVVAHGGTLKGLLVLLMDLPADLFWRFSVDHASISVVNTYKDTAKLERWNDISHLEERSA